MKKFPEENRMSRSYYKTPIVLLIVTAFLHAYVMPSSAKSNKDKGKVRVAFLGVKFEGTPEDIEKRLYTRYKNLLEDQSSFILKRPEDVRIALGGEQVEALLDKPDSLSYKEAAEKLGVDHIFSGRIADHSREEARVLLVGAFYRYDKKLDLLHKFEILKYYDTIGVELVKFDQEYVQTIVPVNTQKKVLWPWLVVAGLGVVSLAALALVGFKAGADGESEQGEPTDF
jgi:acetolactate synthase small subunit